MHNQIRNSWILVPVFAATLVACNFDTSGLKEISTNNANNANNVNNANNINNLDCGNGVIEANETCDATDLSGQSCVSLGYLSGTLACRADCTNFDVTACVGATCGNGLIEGLELCDGANLAGNTCAGLGFARGELVCNADCFGFDTSGCTRCGNDTLDSGETCDGVALAGRTCATEGFAAGDLACNADCTGFDTSGCSSQVCGNNSVEGDELCDGTDLAGQTCATQGFFGGTLACNANCNTFVTSGCNLCGNNLIDGPESCDGSNLNGRTCQTLGCRVAGTPQCNAFCNAFLMQTCWANHDEDADGVDDHCDNCPTYANANQANADGDQIGNLCESPAGATALATIHTFESLFGGTTVWNVVRGTWSAASDQVSGYAEPDSDANYLHPLSLAANNYSVEVNFGFRADPVAGDNWSGVIFGWTPATGSLTSAYECVFERPSKELQIWKYTTYNSMGWVYRTGVPITTSATNSHLRKVRAYVSGTTVRCEYSDASGASGTVSWTDPYFSNSNGFSGKAGFRLYNESANFTSFVYYTN